MTQQSTHMPYELPDEFIVPFYGASAIKAFAAAGGKFTDRKDEFGMSAAMYVVSQGGE